MKKNYKALLAMMLAIVMMLSLTACGGAAKKEEPEQPIEETEVQPAENAEEAEQQPEVEPAEEAEDVQPEEEEDVPEEAAEPAEDNISRIGDVSALGDIRTYKDAVSVEGAETRETSMTEEFCVIALAMDDVYYRVVTECSADLMDKIFELDFNDEDYNEKYSALVADLPIIEIENLNEGIPSEEDMSAFVGKTGAELLGTGWSCTGCDLDEGVFFLNYGSYAFRVSVEGAEGLEMTDDFDADEALKPLVATKFEYAGLGDATQGYLMKGNGSNGFAISNLDSEIYVVDDFQEMVSKVIGGMNEWKAADVTIYQISYAGDDANTQENIEWLNSLRDGKNYVEVAELLSNFHIGDVGETTFEADTDYLDYQWWFAREEGGELELVTWGY